MPLLSARAAAVPRATDAAPETRTTFSVDYILKIRRDDPGHARVRWVLAGIEEIAGFRLVFRDDRTSGISGTGRLERAGRTIHWTPGGPYAHLAYTVAIDRHRPPGGPRFDSYAGPDWIATRALHLFPQIHVAFRAGAHRAKSRARLLFQLPRGWQSMAIGEPLAEHVFGVSEPGKRFDRPRGWMLLGSMRTAARTIAGCHLTIATAPGSALDVPRLLGLWERTLPLLANVIGPPPPHLLLVSAPDPMWRGGISGEDSFYVNGGIRVRSADRTSTYLHEVTHVWQPFRPGPDGRWISEGLAEYYALTIQHRAGALSDAAFARGIALFARQGRWGSDLSRSHEPAALNNSAPLVLYWLDQKIARDTDGRQSLDDVVRRLAREGGVLSTASLLRAVNRTTDRDVTPLFRRYVFRGEQPPMGSDPVLPGPARLGYRGPSGQARP